MFKMRYLHEMSDVKKNNLNKKYTKIFIVYDIWSNVIHR